MTATTDLLVALCTCPDRAVAERLAELAVTQGLAACVNIVPGLESHYLWQGERECAQEILLVAKTTRRGFAPLCAAWQAAHPYELPEIIAVPVAEALAAYAHWVREAVTCDS